MSIIQSHLDNDLYKFTMANAVFSKFPNYSVEYRFDCRNEANWDKDQHDILLEEIDSYCKIRFQEDELDYLYSLNLFSSEFIQYLRGWQPNSKNILTVLSAGKLKLILINGTWLDQILLEVPLLAMINEVWFSGLNWNWKNNEKNGYKKLDQKLSLVKNDPNFKFADFGTRRRFSFPWQGQVIEKLKDCTGFVGTSNVFYARKYNLTPIGTMAHEWIMGGAGRPDTSFLNSQKAQLQTWSDVYRGNLGIALTDTYGMKKFLKDFDLYFAKLYDGLRHDSGDPFEWGDMAIEHYKKLGIDPTTKTLVFSDGLTIEKAIEINKYFEGRAKISFGIGTHLTNDFDYIEPLKIVIKMTRCNEHPTIKISDEPAKTMCMDEKFKEYALDIMQVY